MTTSADALVLIGPMGAGKTSIGKRVAKALEQAFADTDAMVVREHGPIADLFATRGEAAFRALEREAVRSALSTGGVVALGGGAVLDADTRGDLARHRVVLLTVDAHIVAGRVGGTARPLLDAGDANAQAERWSAIFAARKPIYDSLADVTFDTSRGPLQNVVDAIVDWAASESPQEDS